MNKPEERQKIAFITGGAKRLGEAMTQALHEFGYKVAIGCSQSLTHAQKMADSFNHQFPNSAKVFSCNFSELKNIQGAINDVLSWHGRLDLLINNAACFYADDDDTHWQQQFAINTMAPFYLSEEAFDALSANNGLIINIADIYGLEPKAGYAVYSMTKAALISQTKSLAVRYAPKVRVNAICPGAMLWPDNDAFSDGAKQDTLQQTLLQRLGGEKPIVCAMRYLIENDFVTKEIMRVDGGIYS